MQTFWWPQTRWGMQMPLSRDAVTLQCTGRNQQVDQTALR